MASGVANALYTPAMQAVLPTLVDAGDLLNAISLNAVQFNLARAVGPMLTAFTYAVIGPEGCFIVNGVTFLALAVLLARIRIPAGPAVAPPSLAHALGEGLRYARSHVVIGPALRLAAVISVLGFPYIILLPALARDALHLESASGLGYLMACVGMGAVLGGLALSAAGDVPRKGLVAVASSLGFSATLAAFALVHRFAATCVLLFVLGFLQTACVASLNTTIQVAVDDGMRGRIMSIMTVLLFGFSTVGGLLVGALGDRIGVPRAIAAGAAVVFCAGLATLVRTPTLLRRLEAAPVTG
jgi:MFS family permease